MAIDLSSRQFLIRIVFRSEKEIKSDSWGSPAGAPLQQRPPGPVKAPCSGSSFCRRFALGNALDMFVPIRAPKAGVGCSLVGE